MSSPSLAKQVGFYLNMMHESNLEGFKSHLRERPKAERTRIANSKSEYGETLLTRAVFIKKDFVEFLLEECGADPNFKADFGSNPLIGAIEKGELDTVRLLVSFGADVNAIDLNTGREYCTCLMAAVKNSELCDILLRHDADVNVKSKNGFTALHFAVDEGNVNSVELLITRGAEYSWCGDKNNVLQHGNEHIVKYMIKFTEQSGVDVIHAYELLSANLVISDAKKSTTSESSLLYENCKYWIKAMELRFKDLQKPVLKMLSNEPKQVYEYSVEPQNMDELQDVLRNKKNLPFQALLIVERILGTNNQVFLDKLKVVRKYINRHGTKQSWTFIALKYVISILENNSHLIKDNSDFNYVFHDGKDLLTYTDVRDNLQSTCFALLKLSLNLNPIGERIWMDNIVALLYNLVTKYKLDDSRLREVEMSIEDVCVLNPTDHKERSLLHIACKFINDIILVYIPNHDIPFDKAEDMLLALYKVVQIILKGGAKINHRNCDGLPALFEFVSLTPETTELSGKISLIVKLMIESGAHMDIPVGEGKLLYQEIVKAFPQFSRVFEMSLQCLAARVVVRCKVPYKDRANVPKKLVSFISLHDGNSKNINL